MPIRIKFILTAILVGIALFSCNQNCPVSQTDYDTALQQIDTLQVQNTSVVTNYIELARNFDTVSILYASLGKEYCCLLESCSKYTYDTVVIHDTILLTDYVHDTILLFADVHDTVWLEKQFILYDTIYEVDTIYLVSYDTLVDFVHDTVEYFIDTVPFTLYSNCFMCVVDSFKMQLVDSSVVWFYLLEDGTTVRVYRDEKNFWIIGYEFVDTVVNTYYYDTNNTSLTQGLTRMTISGYSTECSGEVARLKIVVDGNVNLTTQTDVLGYFTLPYSEVDQTLIFIINKDIRDIKEVQLVFDNDCYLPDLEEDRNVFIKRISIGDQYYQTLDSVSLGGNAKLVEDGFEMLSDGVITIKVN